ncbi:MAG: pseudaminic acid synthase, partial [Campylobacter sp.]|nr:pseudaminic acid synthase [Campylobacter sp.]
WQLALYNSRNVRKSRTRSRKSKTYHQRGKKAGASAVKIQTYTADTITLNSKKPEFMAGGAWSGQSLYELYQDAYTPWEWTDELVKTAKELDITLFSSPFDYSSVDFLEKYDMPAYKIASPEIVDTALVAYIASTKKPIVMSTGSASLAQIDNACEIIAKHGVSDLAILKCTSEYPADPKDINLKSMQFLKELYKCPIGLSDHTLGTAVPIAAVALGANIIEKHFILDKDYKTADSFFSADITELTQIVSGAKMAQDAIGEVKFNVIQKPTSRSLISTKAIKKGEVLVEGVNFRSVRPGGGIEPKFIDIVRGRIAQQDIDKHEFLRWEMIGGLK